MPLSARNLVRVLSLPEELQERIYEHFDGESLIYNSRDETQMLFTLQAILDVFGEERYPQDYFQQNDLPVPWQESAEPQQPATEAQARHQENKKKAPEISRQDLNRACYREQQRFEDGEYVHVPWNGRDFTFEKPSWNARYPYHYPHYSMDKDGMLAFSENEAKLVADRQTRMKPGKYLKRFYGDVLSDDQISDLVSEFMIRERNILPKLRWVPPCPADADRETLEFIRSMWIEVYAEESMQAGDSGYKSCMRGTNYVAVYAHPGNRIALAYLESDCEEEGEGKILARAIVTFDYNPYNPDKYPDRTWENFEITDGEGNDLRACFVRIYGEDEYQRSYMQTVLRDQLGIRRRQHLLGFKLGKIEADNDCGFLMPYLDHDDDEYYLEEYDSYFVVTDDHEADWTATETDGTAESNEPKYECYECEERFRSNSDLSYVSAADYNNGGYVCSSCLEKHFVLAYDSSRRRGSRSYIYSGDAVYCESNEEYYRDNEEVLDFHGIRYVNSVGEYRQEDELVYFDGLYHLQHHCQQLDYAYLDEDGNEVSWCLEEDAIQTTTGSWAHQNSVVEIGDEFVIHPQQLEMERVVYGLTRAGYNPLDYFGDDQISDYARGLIEHRLKDMEEEGEDFPIPFSDGLEHSSSESPVESADSSNESDDDYEDYEMSELEYDDYYNRLQADKEEEEYVAF